MSTGRDAEGPDVEAGIRAMLLLMPRLVGRVKRTPPPDSLAGFALAPRHLSLLGNLLFDGPMPVNALAERLEVAPTTVSLMVGDLSRQGILERREDPSDRRRTIVALAAEHHDGISRWLAKGADAWRVALEPLTPSERRAFIETIRRYEEAVRDL
ncbi:MarR family winged helix-turn-helix transcriptional regulator [Actinomadura rupiterrae]|uniref:MarR family winged helix-turn-helix transcriptional regulator n=1 Tax=Actinomadura rupiterrae TaxID=559627 RepID=UPI0020A3EDC6|nr:MarR family winged helix-turn-helix transcriptional regulator [Actinomadura rupiterrae]MCP2343025.1 DNA-binding MarR family transcriptional regulator [Actinomadura rupiterrae]